MQCTKDDHITGAHETFGPRCSRNDETTSPTARPLRTVRAGTRKRSIGIGLDLHRSPCSLEYQRTLSSITSHNLRSSRRPVNPLWLLYRVRIKHLNEPRDCSPCRASHKPKWPVTAFTISRARPHLSLAAARPRAHRAASRLF
ncbi:hypothetical protein EVAR_82081_1 [Eumeta japonica]|uniref:Uncharacterized protein n=1 Tax=Eumeta variegata TaxID=151549 RepID=A0A4C1U1U0_EUMVA|nr:hypothetical protein EVAR_82081_1 [Eumeta japonica]